MKESLNQVYNSPTSEDPHYITFSPYDKELHGPIRQDIYKPKVRFSLLLLLKPKFSSKETTSKKVAIINELNITINSKFNNYFKKIIILLNKFLFIQEGDNKAIGFSWVQPGSLQPFSKPDAR